MYRGVEVSSSILKLRHIHEHLWLASHSRRFIPERKVPNTRCMETGRTSYCRSGCWGKARNLFLKPGIKPRSLSRRIRSLAAIPNEQAYI